MKKQYRVITAITMVLLLTASLGMTCFASSGTKYAYSIGVNHATTDSNEGNFTSNVQYASTCYGMMSNFRSYYQTTPSSSYLCSETNPNGVRKIASDVVFLNGHANATCMAFGENLGSAIYYGYDTSDSNYQYAGLKSIGTMDTVDLISFVVCKTAEGTTNLASVAYDEGATTVVGFTNSITSRYYDGPRWLERYNDHLANGYTVQEAVNYASAVYPNCDLSTYVKIYGNTSNTITSSARTSSMELQLDSFDISVDVSGIENVNKALASECASEGFTGLVSQLEEIDSDFSVDDYKVTVNMYSDNQMDGMIMFTYYIGEDIATNKAYVVTVKDGIATEIIPSGVINTSTVATCNYSAEEESLITAASLFEQQRLEQGLPMTIESNNIPEDSQLVETRTQYYFDYTTNELSYSETYFYCTSDATGVYIDSHSTWIIDY